MERKTIVLLVVACILAVLTFYDYLPVEDDQSVEKKMAKLPRVERLVALVQSEKEIQSVYGEASIPYAQLMAVAKTFYFDKVDSKRAAQQLITELVVEQDAKVESISVGEPHFRGDGVFSISASVNVTAFTHRSAFRILSSLADFNKGLTWKSFSLRASVDDKKIVILGDLVMVLVLAQE